MSSCCTQISRLGMILSYLSVGRPIAPIRSFYSVFKQSSRWQAMSEINFNLRTMGENSRKNGFRRKTKCMLNQGFNLKNRAILFSKKLKQTLTLNNKLWLWIFSKRIKKFPKLLIIVTSEMHNLVLMIRNFVARPLSNRSKNFLSVFQRVPVTQIFVPSVTLSCLAT